jgi:hypothetical protein
MRRWTDRQDIQPVKRQPSALAREGFSVTIELHVWRHGDGALHAATPLDDQIISKLPRGQRYVAKLMLPRSHRQNNLLHGIIQAAFANQRGGPQVESWEALKGWLLIQAGHCTETAIDLRGMRPSAAAAMAGAVAAALRERSTFAEVAISRERSALLIRTPKSVSFKKADSETMQPVVDRVLDIICTQVVPGTTPEQVMDMARRKA